MQSHASDLDIVVIESCMVTKHHSGWLKSFLLFAVSDVTPCGFLRRRPAPVGDPHRHHRRRHHLHHHSYERSWMRFASGLDHLHHPFWEPMAADRCGMRCETSLVQSQTSGMNQHMESLRVLPTQRWRRTESSDDQWLRSTVYLIFYRCD